MIFDRNPVQIHFLFVITFLLLLQGCDQTGVDPGPEPTPASPEQLQVTEASDGHAFYDFYRDDSRNKTSEPSGSRPSIDSNRYSCYMSNYVPGEGYYVKSIYLNFPASVMEGVEQESIGIVRWTRTNEAVDHPSNIEAMVICRIPQIRQAADMVLDHFDLQGSSAVSQKNTAQSDSSADRNRSSSMTVSARSESAPAVELSSGDEHRFLPVLDGRVPNNEGYTCMDGTDWLSFDQQYCTNGDNLYFPEVPVDAPEPDPDDGSGSGDSGGGGTGNDYPPGADGPLPDPAPREGEGGGGPVPEDEVPCEYTSSPENCIQDPDPCDTNGDYPVLDDATVQQAMSQAWLASYGSEDSPLPHSQRNEAMFMVLATSSGYEIKEIPAGPETSSCHFDRGNFDIPSNIAALIHTHPYSVGDTVQDPRCGSGEANLNEPSGADMQIVRAIKNNSKLPPTPMYVMDKDKVRIIKPSDSSQYGESINRCGY